jgi:hypothetical protein
MTFFSWLRNRKLVGSGQRRRQPKAVHKRAAFLPRLEALEDRRLPSTFGVTNTGDSGTGSLRQAILDSNATPGTNTIDFNIPGTGVQVIQPLSELPGFTNPVVIDGTSQPGYAGSPLIELDGSSAGVASALGIYAGSSTVEGLAIDNWSAAGIVLATGSNNVVQKDYIGVTPDGNSAASAGSYGINVGAGSSNNLIQGDVVSASASANISIEGTNNNTIIGNMIGTNAAGTAGFAVAHTRGIWVSNGGQDNTIGGSAAADRNVISGIDEGVLLDGTNAPTDNNVVAGNYIGTDVTGTVAIGNTGDGVDAVSGASNNVIGGTAPGAGNLICGNGFYGVGIFSASNANTVEGNVIGSQRLANGADGVYIISSANNLIGGTASGAGNTIAYNRADGVLVTGAGAVGNSIRGNSIYKNHGLGIDLTAGGNNLQAAPQLTSAVALSGGMIQLTGTLTSLANTTFTLDFYGGPSSAGHDQGQTYLGSATVTTDANGQATFTVILAAGTGGVVTATATDPLGDTSEFSLGTHVH